MKNKKTNVKMRSILATQIRRICTIALVAVIGVLMAACDDGGGGGGGNSVNGTWKSGDGETITFNNGIFQVTENAKNLIKGTYTTSGTTITMVVTEFYGEALKEGLSEGGIDVTIDETKWYNKAQVINILKDYMKDDGQSDDEIAAKLAEISDELDNMFTTITGTINGNTLTLGEDTYTKDGGSTGPGTDPGTNPGTGGSSGGWTAANVSSIFGDNNIYAITYANGKFVAGGNNGKMAYSTDGVTWTAANVSSIFGDNNIYAIAYGDGKFVAGGSKGKMATSTNGTTWTAVDVSSIFGSEPIYSIAYGNGTFVAGGSRSNNLSYDNIATSTDGVTWTLVKGSFLRTTRAIAYGNGKFVAGDSNDSNKIAYSSDNGATWTIVDISDITDSPYYYIKSIAYGNGKFVANFGYNMVTSTDGVTWTRAGNIGSSFDAIIYANNKFVAVGDSGSIVTSTDGITWTWVTTNVFDYNYTYLGETYTVKRNLKAIAYGNGKFVVGGNDGTIAYSSGN